MKNYDWSEFKPAEKKEVMELLENAYAGVAVYEKILKAENKYNEFYQDWSHDMAKKMIVKWQRSIEIIEQDYGLQEKQ